MVARPIQFQNSYRSVVPTESATNLMDCKEIKQNNVQKGYRARSLINRTSKRLFQPCVEKSDTGTSCDSWNCPREAQQGKIKRKDVGRTKKVAKCRTNAIKAMRDRDAWKVIIAYAK